MSQNNNGNYSQLQNRENLDDQNWQELLPRLLRFCIYLIYAKTGQSTSKDHVNAGKLAEDYVMDAIIKVYKGDRKWDPDKYPDLLQYLMGVLRSQIGHEHQKLSNRCLVFIENLGDNKKAKIMAAKTDFLKTQELLSEFLRFISDAPKLLDFTTYLVEGLRPREIAKRMQLSPHEIYNIRKVIKRRLCEFLNKNTDFIN
ncbi:MAG: sigma-70 family RNA polymerase sigma factor [Candidatus Omnitrophica bacterium]|nr:sigma-70 family RNA polymerase sigma factor [Candidatus Omnitrophota bacterium]